MSIAKLVNIVYNNKIIEVAKSTNRTNILVFSVVLIILFIYNLQKLFY